MNKLIVAFLAGFIATLAVLVAIGLSLSIVGDFADWSDIDIAIGPVRIWQLERTAASTATYYGPGILLLAALAGFANAAGAAFLNRRSPQRATDLPG